MSSRVQGKIEVLQAVNERNDPVDNDFEPEKDFLERIVDRSEDAVDRKEAVVGGLAHALYGTRMVCTNSLWTTSRCNILLMDASASAVQLAVCLRASTC